MSKVPAWHRNAPAKKAGATPKPKAWAKHPTATTPPPAPHIPRQHRATEADDAGLRRMLSIWDKVPPLAATSPITPKPYRRGQSVPNAVVVGYVGNPSSGHLLVQIETKRDK